jgi:hypothetical protein
LHLCTDGGERSPAQLTIAGTPPPDHDDRPGSDTPGTRARNELVKNGTLKTYHGYAPGMPTTHADVINADLLAWLQQ